MKIFINDQEVEFSKPETVSHAVEKFISTGSEIVILNGKYLSKEDCDKFLISNGDRIDIIKFLAGG